MKEVMRELAHAVSSKIPITILLIKLSLVTIYMVIKLYIIKVNNSTAGNTSQILFF